MKRTLLAIALAVASVPAVADDTPWTIHTASVHFGPGTEGLNNVNPGVAYQFANNVRVGGLYNSYKLPSVYAAYIHDVTDNFHVGLGVVSGYTWSSEEHALVGKANSVVPLLAVEADITDNVSLVWFGQAINLEVKF